MKYCVMFAYTLALIACGTPNIDDKCNYDGVAATYESLAKCYKEYSKNLEHKIEILELKMKYECKDGM